MFISDLNLKDISSSFVEALEEQDVELPSSFNNILFDFNSRNINPKNFNNTPFQFSFWTPLKMSKMNIERVYD